MSEQPPAPDFDAQNYARPNQNWICGHAWQGNACRQGPDAKGRCRATAECKPVLETKPGETKGRWRCTRPGCVCEAGPLPDGSCCRPIAKCSPVPTLRVKTPWLLKYPASMLRIKPLPCAKKVPEFIKAALASISKVPLPRKYEALLPGLVRMAVPARVAGLAPGSSVIP